jgi:hypothetical protein
MERAPFQERNFGMVSLNLDHVLISNRKDKTKRKGANSESSVHKLHHVQSLALTVFS